MNDYSHRLEGAHPLVKKLFGIMEHKKSNLCLSADVTTSAELLRLAETAGPSIAVLKTHVDMLRDFTAEVPATLRAIANEHNFLLFEDRKFADIGSTVLEQYRGGLYRIVEWADLTNAHILPGPGIIKGLREAGLEKGRGLLLLAEMSSEGSLARDDYSLQALELAEKYPDFVVGFITQTRFSKNPRLIHMTPGIQFTSGGDDLGQQYRTPEQVLGKLGSDIAIVGRGITQADNPQAAAAEYRAVCWEARSGLNQLQTLK